MVLYIYDFGDVQYMVDDAGGQWFAVEQAVFCDSCFDEVKEGIDNGDFFSCWNCVDYTIIEVAGFPYSDVFLYYGMGSWDYVNNVNITIRHDEDVILEIATCVVLTSPSRWREIILDGVVWGYSFVGEVE